MSDFEKLVDEAHELAYKEIKESRTTYAQKMRKLVDEYGNQPKPLKAVKPELK